MAIGQCGVLDDRSVVSSCCICHTIDAVLQCRRSFFPALITGQPARLWVMWRRRMYKKSGCFHLLSCPLPLLCYRVHITVFGRKRLVWLPDWRPPLSLYMCLFPCRIIAPSSEAFQFFNLCMFVVISTGVKHTTVVFCKVLCYALWSIKSATVYLTVKVRSMLADLGNFCVI